MPTTRYSDYPGHALEHVPQEVLDAARAVMADAVTWKDVDPDQAEPIADAVVAAIAADFDITTKGRLAKLEELHAAAEQWFRDSFTPRGKAASRRLRLAREALFVE